MLNPTHGNWKALVTKPVLFASGSILTALTVFSFAQGDSAQRIAIAATVPSAITSILFLGHQKGKVEQLKRSQQQAEQELQGKQQELHQLKAVLKHKEETYQTWEASLTQENQQLLETKEALERKLQETQGMESLLTEDNEQLVKSKSALEQEFKEQEEGYLQEIEQLDLTIKQLEQAKVQLKEEIKQVKEQLQVSQESLNDSVSSSPSFDNIKIALVGGDKNSYTEIQEIMEQEYKVKKCKVISNDNVLRFNTFKDKVKDVDYIFVISSVKNPHKKNLSHLERSEVFKGKVINLAHSHSNREIIPSIVDTLQG